MKFFRSLFMAVLWLVSGSMSPTGNAAAAIQPEIVSCKSCHDDFTTLLASDHPSVTGNAPASCTVCHQPGMAKNSSFSSRMHLAHLPPRGDVDCLTCHSWSTGENFGLHGSVQSWGAPTTEDMNILKEIVNSWAASEFMDNLHAKNGISCADCHGPGLPMPDTTVKNIKCLECHGPMEQLAKKTEPIDFKDRNPHHSHLGEIDCTVCHKAHSESKVYCLGCHQQFKMTISKK